MGKRAAIYCRVSHEEQVEGWSLDAQQELCLDLVIQKGWVVDPKHIYQEPGRSAKTDARPAFQRMMHFAQHKAFDCIIVHKLDRYSRSLVDVVKNVAVLEQAGIDLVSVTEPWVDSTGMGKFMLHLFSLLAQWDNENRARETAKGKAARARAGLWNGTLAFGYTTLGYLRRDLLQLGEQFEAGVIDQTSYTDQSSRIERHIEKWDHVADGDAIPHPINESGVLLAFESYRTGLYSDRDIAQILNDAGYRTTGNWGQQPFENDTVRPLLQNRFYLGETSYKGQPLPGRHDALINEGLFNECQEVRARRRGRTARNKPTFRVYPLSRLAVCAVSHQPLRGQPGSGGAIRYYRAPKRVAADVRQPMIPAEGAEQTLIAYLSQIQLPEDWRERVMAMVSGSEVMQETVEDQTRRLKGRLDRLKTLYKLGDIEEVAYMNERSDLLNQLEALQPAAIPELEAAATVLEQVGSLLQHATPQELKVIFHSLLTTVYLHAEHPGYVVAIEPKPVLKTLMDISLVPQFAATPNSGIMGQVDVGEFTEMAEWRRNPVAPALGTDSQSVVRF